MFSFLVKIDEVASEVIVDNEVFPGILYNSSNCLLYNSINFNLYWKFFNSSRSYIYWSNILSF